MKEVLFGFKLVRRKPNGRLGPLFINRGQDIEFNVFLPAEDHKTPGFEHRPGWHATLKPEAPHLKMRLANGEERVWVRVAMTGTRTYDRPESQGGTWVLAQEIMFLEEL